jgi:hypothetical protein
MCPGRHLARYVALSRPALGHPLPGPPGIWPDVLGQLGVLARADVTVRRVRLGQERWSRRGEVIESFGHRGRSGHRVGACDAAPGPPEPRTPGPGPARVHRCEHAALTRADGEGRMQRRRPAHHHRRIDALHVAG